jgi:dihydroxynaphthoic acid synthetase
LDYQHVIYATGDGIARITINRPEVLNAYTDVTLSELTDAFVRAGEDNTVGVIVITGAGERAFCAGGDINWEAGEDWTKHGGTRAVWKLYAAMRATLKPCIARVNGYAIGGGHHLHYFCDLSIAADHAIFGQNGPRVGSPAQGWIVSYLVRVVGAKRAREMWMLCRRYKAAQALDWGLVNAVVPYAELDAEVDQWCKEILSLSPSCIKALKATFDTEYEPLRDVMDQHDFIEEINPGYWDSGEQQEGAKAFLEKRTPDFSRWR